VPLVRFTEGRDWFPFVFPADDVMSWLDEKHNTVLFVVHIDIPTQEQQFFPDTAMSKYSAIRII
jgi:hypothetical protein